MRCIIVNVVQFFLTLLQIRFAKFCEYIHMYCINRLRPCFAPVNSIFCLLILFPLVLMQVRSWSHEFANFRRRLFALRIQTQI